MEQNEHQKDAIEIFYKMKAHPGWRAAYRLGTCAPGDRDEFIALQPADLIAYETFRLVHERHFGFKRVRKALQKMWAQNGFSGFYYEPDVLESIKPTAENDTSEPNGCIIIQEMPYTEESEDAE